MPEGEFSWRVPKLAGLQAPQGKRMRAFLELILEKHLVRWISKGWQASPASEQCLLQKREYPEAALCAELAKTLS